MLPVSPGLPRPARSRLRSRRGAAGLVRAAHGGDPVSLARRHCRLLAGSAGVSEAAIGEWGLLERVSSGLYIWSLGAADLAGPFLDTAEMPMLPTSARRP